VTKQAPKKFQQVELVGINFIVTEYFCWHSHCDHCQRDFISQLPPETKSGLFGVNLIALTAYLKGRCHMSYTTLRDFYSDVFLIKVSTGFLAKQVRQCSHALKKPYEELLKQLPKEPHLHVDESGHKKNGKLGWTWCFRGKQFTLFPIDESRGSVVLENRLGKSYAGILSSDFYSAYRKIDRLSLAKFQYCWLGGDCRRTMMRRILRNVYGMIRTIIFDLLILVFLRRTIWRSNRFVEW
jgi:transposase